MPTHLKIKAKIHKDFAKLYNTKNNNLHLITNKIIKYQIKKVAYKLEECKIIK